MDILKQYYNDNYSAWKSAQIFPIEIDISSLTHINEDFNARLGNINNENDDDDDELINPDEDYILQSVLKVCYCPC